MRSKSALSVAVRGLLVVLGGLFFAFIAALAGSFLGNGVAHAGPPVASTCAVSSGAAQISLGDGLSTVVESGGNLNVSNGGSPSSCALSSITSGITFQVAASATPTQLILDQTGGVFPCLPISGSIGNILLQVTATTSETISFGTTGLSLSSACSNVGTLTGVSSNSVTTSAGPVTVSANGSNNTGSATTATLTGPPNTSGTTYTLAGDVSFQPTGPGSYTIALSGSGNKIVALGDAETYNLSGSSPIQFQGASGGSYTINGLPATSVVNAGSGTESYSFATSSSLLFQGVTGGTYAITGLPASSTVTGAGTGSYTFSGGAALQFLGVSGGSYTINGLPTTSQVTAGAGTESFTINGNSNTKDTFTAGSGTSTFTFPGTGNSNNTLNGRAGTGSFTLTGDNNQYVGATGTDTVNISGNSNTFQVGSETETFYDSGSSNTVDFSAVGASPAAQLFINDSGSTQIGGGTTLNNGQASVSGSSVIYTFHDSPTATTSVDFTTLKGASNGSTNFLAGASGGISLVGQGRGNSASFFGNSGIVANVSGALQITNAQLSQSSSPLTGFQIGSGQVLVGSPGTSTSCSGTPIAPFCDVLTNVFTITGPSGGFSTFYAGPPIPTGDTYQFSDNGDFNTFIGGTGPAAFSSAGNHNTFVAGFGNETFSETTTSQVPSNTIDFSNVPVGNEPGCTGGPCTLLVNVSGAGATVSNFVAAVINSSLTKLATYSFGGSNGGANFTNFIGSSGGNTTFLAGSGAYTYTGQGVGNSLDFSNSPVTSTLTFDVTHAPLPQAQLGAVPETFSGVTNLVGLATGSTTFIGGSTAGYTFDGRGSGNQAVFTSQGPSTTLSVSVTLNGSPVSGGTVTFSVAGGSPLCSAVPVSPTGIASCYPTSLPSGQVQIVAAYTPPAGSSFTGSGVVLTVVNGTGTTTSTTTTINPLGGPLFQGQPVTLSATVTPSSGTVSSGSVSFFLAGSQTAVCTYTLPATSCSTSSLPAGNYNLLAVYTPGSGFSGSAGTAAISVNAPPSSSVSVSYVGVDPSFFFLSDFSVTYSVPGGSTGQLCITSPDPSTGTTCQTVTASGTTTFAVFVSKNDQVLVQLIYSSGPTPFSGSAASTGALTGVSDFGSFQPTNTAISASVNGVTVSSTTAGTTVNFTITVTAPGATLPAGGQLTVQIVGGAVICSVPVPGGAASAALFCSAALPAGTDNIVATYDTFNFCCGGGFTGSTSVIVLNVSGPTSGTVTTGSTPTTDPVAGVVVNLSSTPYTTTNSVQVPGGDVLVAAPPSGTTSCSGAPIPSFCDSLIGITTVTGSAGGHNTFVAGTSSEVLTDPGSVGGDTLDLSRVQTGSSSSTLTVNVTGGNGSFVATVAGGGPTYNFSGVPVNSPGSGPDFTHFVGSSQGSTTFLAGPNGGYSFTAQGSFNSVDFSAAGPVSVDLSGSTLAGTVSGLSGGNDSIFGLSNVIGSSQGSNTFRAGSALVTYNFTGPGNNNHFFAGTSSDVFNDPGSNNTVDFSNLPNTDQLTVNVSPTLASPSPNTAAGSNGSTYTFSAVATTFVGSPGGSKFFAGSALDTFVGAPSPAIPNELSYFFASGTPLTISLVSAPATGACAGVSSAGQATLNGATQAFCNISVFDGLQGGSTTFVAGDAAGGYTFNGTGTGNVADFSAAQFPVKIDLSSTSHNVTLSTSNITLFTGPTDTITGITTVTGSSNGRNTFVAGPTSATFEDNGFSGGDTIDFSKVLGTTSVNPLTINASGKLDVLNPYTAAFGSNTWTFSTGGPGFTNFIGAFSGNAKFLASGTVTGFTFDGLGSNNTVDFSTNSSGVVVDLTSGQAQLVGIAGHDTLTGAISTVIGSPVGANTFFGALTGTTFTSQSSNNTLSYAHIPGPVTIDLTTGSVSGSDSFTFPNGTLTVVGTSGADTFIAGTRAVTIQGGGGGDILDLSHLQSGANVNLAGGTVTGSSFGTIKFAPCTSSPTASQLCLSAVTGTPFNDTFTVESAGPALSITGNGGVDTLDLSRVPGAATVDMVAGTVSSPSISFSGISNVIGTQAGGDYFFVATGTESFNEIGSAPGTLDFSKLPTAGTAGVTVTVNDVAGVFSGTVSSPVTIGATDNFQGISTFIGTPGNDTFIQNGPSIPSGYSFQGAGGNNTLNLTGAAQPVQISLGPGTGCATGTNNGTAMVSGTSEQFTCMGNVITSSSIYLVEPGATATLNGGGSGTLELVNATTGATIDLSNGTVSGGGYGFSFSGMSTIDGTPYNDVFIAGPGNYTLNGSGGADSISFSAAPSAVVVNDSASPYTIPAGFPGAGTIVPAFTATGGYGGTIKLTGIPNIFGTASSNDIIVAGPGPATIVGGTGSDRFVLTGGSDYLYAGSGASTLDLSPLPGQTSLDLATSNLQTLGANAGSISLAGGNIQTVIASPGGSQIWGGTGNITLLGGPGGDWLAAGTGNQTLNGGGGSDTLVGGIGNDTLQGGAQPVTFVPGQGSDTLTSTGSGNTLSYSGAPSAVQVNLSTGLFSVPAGEPFAGTTLAPQTATGGWGATVSLVNANITQVIGTSQPDIFVTGPTGSTINGNGGSDLFIVLSGNNRLFSAPGSGSRFVFDGPGSNFISGGGNDTVDFSLAPGGVTVNLQTGNASGPSGWFEQLSGILNIIGSNFNDVLVAGAPGGTIIGLNGNDLLQAGPSGGDTLISGGNGSDTFCAQSSCAVAGTSAGGGDTMIGGAGNDTFFAVNGVPDSIDGGGGFNTAFVDPKENQVINVQQVVVQ